MRLVWLSALLWAALAQAFPTPSVGVLAPAQSSKGAPPEEDDEEEEDAAPPQPSLVPQPSPGVVGVPTLAPQVSQPAPSAEEQRLVSGAPLYNPNVAVHIIEQKAFSDSGKREIVLFPVAAQANGKFTQHLGTFGSFVWHLQENFGLQVTGGYNWFNAESGFNTELVSKVRAEAQAATSLLWIWGIMGGVEVTPLYGKFALFERTLGHFSIVLNAGAGAGGTRHQLKPESLRADGSLSAATFGDTGARFMASLGFGFRLQLGSRFAFRLEMRDVLYAARVERVNGCNVDDLRLMNTPGADPAKATVGGACNLAAFTGTEDDGTSRTINIPLALNLVKVPSSDVLNNVGLYLGGSLLF